ncbi:MAG: TIGR01212 family radical SAM protein [Anaeroplasmataceae bacterium]|nr:TIGR01212 family radical SAM protein [Anaeroplasmataceae bacterium]
MTKEKHYNTLNEYYKNKYNCKVAKIALNADFSCPNKDGTKGSGGCIYCSKLGSGDMAGNKNHSLKQQFEEIKAILKNKWPDAKYIPYLQANSNTYAPIQKLKSIYEEILLFDKDIVGLAIATRPDCFTLEIYDYLESLNQKIPLTIELGLQTINPQTIQFINRCSTNEEFVQCVQNLRKRNIEVVVHIINGLPHETKEDMLNTIRFLNTLDIQGIKFHMLLILKDTPLEQYYLKQPFPLLTLEEYVSIVSEQIAILKPSIIIHRLCADGVIEDLIAPKWTIKKLVVMNEIDKHLRKHNIYQGDHFNLSTHHH